MTFRQAISLLTEASAEHFPEEEARSIARRAVTDLYDMDLTSLVCSMDRECDGAKIELMAGELRRGRPVQYVTGKTQFMGLEIGVREGVLIPRPETELMVDKIIGQGEKYRDILDVGTGSGAIALALARNIEGSCVTAMDISREALETARENAVKNGVDIRFVERDALSPFDDLGRFDLIVSNPPYIPSAERKTMHPSVTDFEPAEALFVPDTDPVVFYRAIASSAYTMLRDGGSLWFEIHENYWRETAEAVRDAGFTDVRVERDQFEKFRYVWSRR